jgi:hypothetical protein
VSPDEAGHPEFRRAPLRTANDMQASSNPAVEALTRMKWLSSALKVVQEEYYKWTLW